MAFTFFQPSEAFIPWLARSLQTHSNGGCGDVLPQPNAVSDGVMKKSPSQRTSFEAQHDVGNAKSLPKDTMLLEAAECDVGLASLEGIGQVSPHWFWQPLKLFQ